MGKSCSLCKMFIRYFSYFSFGFEDMVLVLIAPVPGHCLLVTFKERENVTAIVNVFSNLLSYRLGYALFAHIC